MGSYFLMRSNSKESLRPLNKRQAPEPTRAGPYGQAISVSDGQSLSLRPVCAPKLGFTPDVRLRLTMFGDAPLDGTSPPSLTRIL